MSSAASTHPSTWREVSSSMHGFPFPELTSCREVSLGRTTAEDPSLVVLPGGKAFLLQRRLVNSLFGGVYHGIEGVCSSMRDPPRFVTPSQPEQQFHVAVKKSSLAHMRRTPQENVFREISVIRYLAAGGSGQTGGHQFVMPLVAACMSATHVYVVTPYCGGGDLLSMVVPGEGTGEQQARKWFRQILLGLSYVHSMGLCHHDFSPENVVITRMGDAAVVMDFGMVQRMRRGIDGEILPARDEQRFGKFRYMAPEIWNIEEYDGRQIDIWSAGATLLVCLLGDYPWAAPTRIPLESQGIYSSDIYSFTNLEQHGAGVMLERLNLTSIVSAAAVDLLCQMLVVDRGLRPCSAQMLAQHAFFGA